MLGEFAVHGFYGIALLPLLYPRLILLSRDGRVVKYGDIPPSMLGREVEKACYSIAFGEPELSTFLEKAVYTAFFFGGYNLFLEHGGEAIPLALELVNTEKIRLYYRGSSTGEPTVGELGSWVLLGAGLRLGDQSLIEAACSKLGRFEDGKCHLSIFMGELVITTSEHPLHGYVRVVPDNNPARHVVNYDRLKQA